MAREPAEEQPRESPDALPADDSRPAADEPADQRSADEPADQRSAGESARERADGAAGRPVGEAADGPLDGPAGEPRRKRRPVGTVTAVAVATSVVAAGFAAYYGWSWYRAAHDESLHFSRARDAVVRAAEQGVQNLNTLDYRTVDQDFTTWEQSSTGDLHDQLVQGRAQFEDQVRQARTVTTAKILEAAVTELDTRTGKAGVIVAVQITVTPPNGQATTKPSRMRAQLTRTSSGWKLSALGQAPVGTTGSGG